MLIYETKEIHREKIGLTQTRAKRDATQPQRQHSSVDEPKIVANPCENLCKMEMKRLQLFWNKEFRVIFGATAGLVCQNRK